MRLLVHGGTSYGERHRIGEWPVIDRDALESTIGLPDDSIIFGVGVLDNCSPFFIVRSRTVTDIGRSYALSVLIDPGQETWQRFNWNAADLIRAFLLDDLNELLRTAPESLSTEGLRDALKRLRPLASDSSFSDGQKSPKELIEGWIGAAFSDEPVVLNPASLGLKGRPSCEELAFHLTRIEQHCFRIGAGWLVGASQQQARALGARLVIDETGSNAKEETDTRNRGKEVTEAWTSIRSDKGFHSLLVKLEDLPICDWENANGVLGSELLQRLRLTAQIVGGECPEQLVENLERQLGNLPFLSAETRLTIHQFLLSTSRHRRLSGPETALVLRNYFSHGLSIEDAKTTEQMESSTLARMLIEYETKNPSAVKNLHLPTEIAIEVYVRKLGAAPQYKNLPRLLKEASEFVSKKRPQGSRQQAEQQKLVDAVGQQILTTTETLHVWDDFPRDHSLWSDLATYLQKAARRRATIRATGWELEYLCFGNDPGGRHLVGITDNKDAYSELVRRYLIEVHEQGDLSQDARKWLEAIAGSPLRPHLKTSQKVEIAQVSEVNSWEPFLFLWHAFNFDEVQVRNVVAQEGETRELLRDELFQMLREFPRRTRFPDLVQIKKILGLIPTDFLFSIINDSRREFTTKSFSKWLDNLRAAGEQELASKEVVTFCVNSRAALPPEWLFNGFDRDELRKLADKLLFDGLSTEDEFYNKRCNEVFATATYGSRLGEACRASCHDNFDDVQRFSNFIRRFSKHEEILARLFVCMSKRQRSFVIRRISDINRDGFIDLVWRILEDVKAGVGLTPYTSSVLEWVRTTAHPDLMKDLVRWRLSTRQGLESMIEEVLSGYRYQADDLDQEDTAKAEDNTAASDEFTTGKALADSKVDDYAFTKQKKEKTPRQGPGFLRSLFRSLLYEEPPPDRNAEESNERLSRDEKDNSS